MTRAFSLAVVCVLSLAFASAANASVTVGQLFTPNSPGDCTTAPTELQTGVGSGNSYTVPTAGIITSWSWNDGADIVPDLEFKVARHLSGNDYKIVGTSPAGAQTANNISTYPTRITVKAGDILGVYAGGGTCGSFGGTGDNYAEITGTNEPLNSSATYASYSDAWIIPVAAKLEADADGDGYGDETQDLCPTISTIQIACPSTTPPADQPRDTTAPSLTAALPHLLKLSKTGSLSFFITSTENASGSATGTISLPKAAKVARFKTAKITLNAGKRNKVTLKLPKSALKAVRKALKHHQLKTRLTVTVKDSAGNKTVKKLTLKLRH